MQGKKIVIIDDEPELLEILSYHFGQDGWKVETANNGQEALTVIDGFQPNVVLSDINMPELDGLGMLEQLQRIGSEIPVILVTGCRDVKKMQRAWAACVFDIVDKPFDQAKLLTLANNAYVYGRDYVKFARMRFENVR